MTVVTLVATLALLMGLPAGLDAHGVSAARTNSPAAIDSRYV